MSIPKSAENIRKLELSLDELIPKFKGRLQLIREDLKSLVTDIETLKHFIEENRRKSNDNTREISDLSNDLQTFHEEISHIEQEIAKSQSRIDSVNNQTNEIQSSLSSDKNSLESLEIEKSTLGETLQKLNAEFDSLQDVYDELQPKYEAKMNALMQDYNRIKSKRELIDNRFQAMRILCSKDYIQSPEIGLIKFLAKKASSMSTITEIRSALGIDHNTLKKVLQKLAARNVLDFDETAEKVNLLVKIDLFN